MTCLMTLALKCKPFLLCSRPAPERSQSTGIGPEHCVSIDPRVESSPDYTACRKQEKNGSGTITVSYLLWGSWRPRERDLNVTNLHCFLGPAVSRRNVSLAFLAHRRCPHHIEESGPLFWSRILDSAGFAMLSILGFTLELMAHCNTAQAAAAQGQVRPKSCPK